MTMIIQFTPNLSATIPKCDKLFGPGNSFVTEAKLQVSRDAAAIDLPAGPSEVMVIADRMANPAFVAADLLSQAEHGPDSQVMLVTFTESFVVHVGLEMQRQLKLLPRGDIAKRALQQSRVILVSSPAEAVEGADFVYTDVWVSMGEPQEAWAQRIPQLLPYQVNEALMRATGKRQSKFMHCLPALHNRDTALGERLYQQFGIDGAEVTEAVFESPASIVWDQAENRLHTIKALLVATLGS